MPENFGRRIEIALARLAGRIERSRSRLDPAAMHPQIGRIVLANQRAAARSDVRVVDSNRPGGGRLKVSDSSAFDEWVARSEGAEAPRPNITDLSEAQLRKAYTQLGQAESAFRIQKDQLRVRPIWQQRAGRAQVHILVSFLAFVL